MTPSQSQSAVIEIRDDTHNTDRSIPLCSGQLYNLSDTYTNISVNLECPVILDKVEFVNSDHIETSANYACPDYFIKVSFRACSQRDPSFFIECRNPSGNWVKIGNPEDNSIYYTSPYIPFSFFSNRPGLNPLQPMFFRTILQLSDGSYSTSEYSSSFYFLPSFSFPAGTSVLVDPPACGSGNTIIKVPYENNVNYIIALSNNYGVGGNYDTRPGEIGSEKITPKNGYYEISDDIPPGLYYLTIECVGGQPTPCPFTTSFIVPSVPPFTLSQPTYATYTDNSQQEIQIRTRGETAQVSFPVLNSRDQSVTIHAGSETSTVALASSTIVSGTTYYNGTVTINLPAGTYNNIYVDNALGCVANYPAEITLKESDLITFDFTPVNPKCSGDNGSIDISNIKGGTGGYSYSLDNGSNWESFNADPINIPGISQGNHIITIKDSYENSSSQSFSIAPAPSPVTATAQTAPPTTSGGNDGTVTVSASGGTPPYQYGKDNSYYQPSNILTDFSSGDKTIYVKDANGCVYSFPVTIPDGRQITIESTATVAPTCNGGADGSCILVIGNLLGNLSVSGLPQYCTYNISDNTITITGLEAGAHSCSITETYNGNTNTIYPSFTIPSKSSIDITPTVTPVSNKNTATGAIAVNVSGGNDGSYRVVLLDEQDNIVVEKNTPNNCIFENLAGASDNGGKLYNIIVYDNKNCSKDTTARVPEPATALELKATLTTPVLCHGNSDAVIDISASGGWGNYLYSADNVTWNTATTFSNLPADAYQFYVKDKNGGTASTTITVTDPQALYIVVDSIADVACFGSATGSIRFLVSGGTPPYSLTPALGIVTAITENGNTYMTVSGLPATNYIFTLTDSHNCSLQAAPATISQPDKLNITTSNLIQPTCGWDNASLTVTASGGIAPYTYTLMLTATNTIVQTITSSAAAQFENIAGGNYYIAVTDNSSCTEQSAPITFNQYTSPAISGAVVNDVVCFGESNGKITAGAQKGTANIDYFTLTNTSDNTTIQSISGVFENLTACNYILYVFDVTGCQSQNAYPIVVKQPEALHIEIDTIVPVINKGANDGIIQFRVTGGNTGNIAVYLKDTNNEKADSVFAVRGFTNELFVKSGIYTLEATDNKGCSFTTETLQIDEPSDSLQLIIKEVQDALCKSQTGKIVVEGQGGWGGYRYKRASDGQYTTLNRFENLYPGTYFITVTDKMGATASQPITVYEPQDSLKAGIANLQPPTCAGNGALSIALSGGTPPYKLYSDAGNDTIFAATPATVQWANVACGSLLLHLTDANGCKFELETVISDTALLRINGFETIPPDVPQGANGSIRANISGGTSPLTYSWKKIGDAASFPNNPLINNLSCGYYELKITDGSGCSITGSVYLPDPGDELLTVIETGDETAAGAANGYAILYSALDFTNIRIINPENNYVDYPATTNNTNFHISNNSIYLNNLESDKWVIIGTTVTGQTAIAQFEINPYKTFAFGKIDIVPVSTPRGSDGSISVEVQGGAGGNTFVWTDEQGNILPSTDDEYSTQLTNLPAGKYKLTVTDRYGNTITKEIEVPAPVETLQLTVLKQKNQSCNGTVDAYVILSAIGGWGDYRYAHYRQPVNNNLEYSNAEVYPDLETGEHYFYVVDKYGVTAQLKITVTEPDVLRASVASVENVKCKDDANGQITFNITGGNPPYYFRESNATVWQKGAIATNFPAGEYTFEFTDSLQCTSPDILAVTVTEPDSLLFEIVEVTHTTCGENNGQIEVSLKGGTRPYAYQWKDPEDNVIGTDSTIIDLHQNTLYRLYATDKNGCTQSLEQLIQPSKSPRITGVETTNVSCYGDSTGSARITAVEVGEPDSPCTFIWSNGTTGDSTGNLPAGRHSVTITDENSCASTYYFDITQPDSLYLLITDYLEPHCFGYSDGYIHTQTFGGAGGYTYEWSNGATTPNIDSIPQGDYWVRVTDANGCMFEKQFTLNEPPYQHIDLGEDVLMCPGNTHVIDGGNYVSYRWFTDKGDISNERYLSVAEENRYYLEAKTPDGCSAWGDIGVSIGNNALLSDMLLASEAAVGDTLVIFELSNLPLDSLKWNYDPIAFEQISIDDEFYDLPYVLELRCLQTGIYNIGLTGYSGGCFSTAIKQVEIVTAEEQEEENLWGAKEPLIQSLKQYPNPSNGIFTVELELREAADAKFTVFEVASGVCLNQRTATGSSYYKESYNLSNLQTGVYVLIVTAGNERRQVKMIIN